MGTIKGEFEGKPTESYKVRVTWELPTELHTFKEGEPEKPYVVSKEMSFSMGKKSTLRPMVEGIIGTTLSDEEAYGFNLDSILGLPCLLSITHKEGKSGVFVSVNTATPLIKGVQCPPQVNPTKVLSYDSWNQEYFDTLPPFIKEKIESTPEYRKLKGLSDEAVVSDSEIPF